MKIKLPLFSFLGLFLLTLAVPAFVLARTPLVAQDSTRGAVVKERWEKIGEELEAKKAEFLRAKQNLGPKATEGARKAALEKAKEFILKIFDRAILRIQKIIDRVEKSPVLTDERKAQLKARLQDEINVLTAQKSKIEAATSGEELRAILKESRGKFASVREAVKKIVLEIIASHIDRTLAKLEEIADRLESQITVLQAQGAGVANLQSQLADGRAKIALAKEANANGDWKLARKRAEEARAILVALRGKIKALQAKTKVATKAATQGGNK